MSDAQKQAAFLRDMHKRACFEHGDHPDEVDTAFSAGADAIARIEQQAAEIARLRAQLDQTTTPAEDAKVSVGAGEALSSYQQADMDGIMVLVSRQSIEECLPALRALIAEANQCHEKEVE